MSETNAASAADRARIRREQSSAADGTVPAGPPAIMSAPLSEADLADIERRATIVRRECWEIWRSKLAEDALALLADLRAARTALAEAIAWHDQTYGWAERVADFAAERARRERWRAALPADAGAERT